MARESEEECYDDLIKLFDFSTENNDNHNDTDGRGIWNLIRPYEECYEPIQLSVDELNTVQPNGQELEYIQECKKYTPNIKLVDCMKFPWYFRKYQEILKTMEKDTRYLDDDKVTENELSEDSDCFIVVDDFEDIKVSSPSNNEKLEYLKLSAEKHISEAVNEKLNLKQEIEKQKALSLRNLTKIDFKRNTGLIGLTIKHKIVKHVTLGANSEENEYRDEGLMKKTIKKTNIAVVEGLNKNNKIKLNAKQKDFTASSKGKIYPSVGREEYFNKKGLVNSTESTLNRSTENDTSLKVRLNISKLNKFLSANFNRSQITKCSVLPNLNTSDLNNADAKVNVSNDNYVKTNINNEILVNTIEPCKDHIETSNNYNINRKLDNNGNDNNTVCSPLSISKINDKITKSQVCKTVSPKKESKKIIEMEPNIDKNKCSSPILPSNIKVKKFQTQNKLEKSKDKDENIYKNNQTEITLDKSSTSKSYANSNESRDSSHQVNKISKDFHKNSTPQLNYAIDNENSKLIGKVHKNPKNIHNIPTATPPNKSTIPFMNISTDKVVNSDSDIAEVKIEEKFCSQLETNIDITSTKTISSSKGAAINNTAGLNYTTRTLPLAPCQFTNELANQIVQNNNPKMNLKHSNKSTQNQFRNIQKFNINSGKNMHNYKSSAKNNPIESALTVTPNTIVSKHSNVPNNISKYTYDIPVNVIPTTHIENETIQYHQSNHFMHSNNRLQYFDFNNRQQYLVSPSLHPSHSAQPKTGGPQFAPVHNSSEIRRQSFNPNQPFNNFHQSYATDTICSEHTSNIRTNTQIRQRSLDRFTPSVPSEPLKLTYLMGNKMDGIMNSSTKNPLLNLNASILPKNASKDVKTNTLTFAVSKPLNTKTEMIAQLNKIACNDVDPGVNIKGLGTNMGVPSNKLLNIGTPKAQMNQVKYDVQNLAQSQKGYSPPILPIPTYVNLLGKGNTESEIKPLKPIIINCNDHTIHKNTKGFEDLDKISQHKTHNQLDKSVRSMKKDEVKKISIEQYKGRLAINNNTNNLNKRRYMQETKDSPRPKINRKYEQSSSGDKIDLGYDSDSTVII